AGAGIFAQAAQAATPTFTSTSDEAGGFSAHFGDNFISTDLNHSFSDVFSFTLPTSFDTATSLTSNFLPTKDLNISGFYLTQIDPTTQATLATYQGVDGTASGSKMDLWSLSAYGLSSGTYTLTVTGTVVGTQGGSYGGDIVVAAVPEPETYAMLMAGLGLVGCVARRRKQA
ncbi:MAG TPA: FxDxF family PEP-CTERM protein, partial [Janthinobacterium sp.]|nr:FxDxF family PEP-CTERM protein [Janthinobacterium sp.]